MSRAENASEHLRCTCLADVPAEISYTPRMLLHGHWFSSKGMGLGEVTGCSAEHGAHDWVEWKFGSKDSLVGL